MSTIAKQFLETPKDQLIYAPPSDEMLTGLQLWTCDFIRDRLTAPLPGPGFEPDQCAERFIFEQDAPSLVASLISSKQVTNKLVWDSYRMPANHFWLEYPLDDNSIVSHVGIMVGMVKENKLAIANSTAMLAPVVRIKRTGLLRLCALLGLPEQINYEKSQLGIFWYLDRLGLHSNTGMSNLDELNKADVETFVTDLIYALFLINTPRVSELRPASIGSPPRKKSRQRDNAVPLVELRRVVLKVGVASPRYQGQAGAQHDANSEARRRLHRVIGHFRTYVKGREQPRVAFVPQHWRGDAALGVLLHERIVKK